MNLALSEHLPLIASAPDGIQKLRGLILELAVRGKLVPQDPTDEPASEVLKDMAAERQQLEASGVYRKAKSLPAVTDEEIAFILPNAWSWVRLGQIGDWGAGATPSRTNSKYYGGGIPWFKSGELTADFISDSEESVTELALKECSLRNNKSGDVLIAMYGATIGKTSILSKPATTNQAVCACTPYNGMFNQYLLLLLKALKPNFVRQGAGGAQPNISREKIVATVAALPPLEEQHRIVARVDELMALCDRLESEQNDSAAAHTQLVETLLGTLTQSTDANDFETNWKRIAEHFDTLFTTDASIAALQKAILQLAVMGKLVPQDPKDEPIHESLQQLDFTQPVSKAGRGSNTSKLPSITENDVEFPAPNGWQWIWLGEIGTTNIGLTYSPNNLSSSGTPVLRSNNVQNGKLNLTDLVRVSTDVKESVLVQEGDLLICARNGSKALVGKTAQIGALNEKMAFGAFMAIFRSPFNSYLRCFINSPLFRRMIDEVNTTTINQITQSNLRSTAVPLPPIAEQCRIVSKVDELMALCESLKTQLAESSRQEARLADALVQQSLGAV